jgi:hypothetical protein
VSDGFALPRLRTRRRKPWSPLTWLLLAMCLLACCMAALLVVVAIVVPVPGEWVPAGGEMVVAMYAWRKFQESRERDES